MYSQGSSEEILGRALKDFADRDSVVIATKVRHPGSSSHAPAHVEAVRAIVIDQFDADGIRELSEFATRTLGQLQTAAGHPRPRRYPASVNYIVLC